MSQLRFHWRLLQGGETGNDTRARAVSRTSTGLPDLARQVPFCCEAEDAGISGLLVDVGAAKPDPLVLCAALGTATSSIEFVIACRSGLIPPTVYVQQINTLSALIGGRIILNVVAGFSPREQQFYGDFLAHDDRYARTEEYLAICRALWRADGPVSYRGKYLHIENAELNTPYVSEQRDFPELFIAGGSDPCRQLAINQGTLWMRLGDTPERLRPSIEPVLEAGKEVGLRMSVICAETHDAALEQARRLVDHVSNGCGDNIQESEFVRGSDSVSIRKVFQMADKEWLTDWLWTGAVRSHGAPTLAVVGAPEEVAAAFIEYKKIGISQFILSGWPKYESMMAFSRLALPLIRAAE